MPPNLGLSTQFLHVPQSSRSQPSHLPQRTLRGRFIAAPCLPDLPAGAGHRMAPEMKAGYAFASSSSSIAYALPLPRPAAIERARQDSAAVISRFDEPGDRGGRRSNRSDLGGG